MKSHYIYTSCSSEMFREVLLLLCDTLGSCVRVPVWCAWFMCALQDACLPCWMLASSFFMCITAPLTTLVSSSWFSLRVFIKKGRPQVNKRASCPRACVLGLVSRVCACSPCGSLCFVLLFRSARGSLALYFVKVQFVCMGMYMGHCVCMKVTEHQYVYMLAVGV
ncbi:hypothetical protein VPH35_078052 [Triticum aestivum]